jgi:uncharacterized protein
MDKLFLDANILFSASYSEKSALNTLWRLKNTTLITSTYALLEANRNLTKSTAIKRLNLLIESLKLIGDEDFKNLEPLKERIKLPPKDYPILFAAIKSKANFLITGDFKDFGPFYNQTIKNVTILPPAIYLKQNREKIILEKVKDEITIS